jgi:hypothetical protein
LANIKDIIGMSKKTLKPSQSYMLMIGAAALLFVRFLRKDFNEWGSIDYYIGAVCAGTIIFSILTLLKNKKKRKDY